MAPTPHPHDALTLVIDGASYQHPRGTVTADQIRKIPPTPIDPSRQIWLDVDDALDQVLAEGQSLELVDGMHFFSDIRAVTIHLDREAFEVYDRKITGAGLRVLPSPDVAVDRDVWLDVPDRRDRKIQDEDVIALQDGMRFFTAPGRINPGARHRPKNAGQIR